MKWHIVFFLFMLFPIFASAHGFNEEVGLKAGILHTFSGVDHFLAMISVGILSVKMDGANIWLVPFAFVLAMLLGGVIGMYNIKIPSLEEGIDISVILLGIAIALNKTTMSNKVVMGYVFLFGLLHGNAHGVEIPKMVQPAFFITGFIVSTISIHILGIFLGEIATHTKQKQTWMKIFGIIISGTGFTLLLQQFIK